MRQARKESDKSGGGKSAPGSLAEREKGTWPLLEVRGESWGRERGTARPGDQLQRGAPQLSEAQASSDS